MRLSRLLGSLGVLSLAAGLAACSDAGGSGTEADHDSGREISPAQAEAALADLDRPIPGLWEHTLGGGGASFTLRTCIGPPEADDDPFGLEDDDRECSSKDIRRVPGGLSVRAVCMTEDGEVTSTGTITGDLRSNYAIAMTVTPQNNPAAQMQMQMQARRLGECPAGVAPGAMVP